jgi:N-acetylglucosamine-6-sulfatase
LVRRSRGSFAVACLGAICLAPALATADTGLHHPAATAPNIVFILTDDQTISDLEAMSQVNRRLTANGTRFTNFYATFPLCCPSRASFLTGRYAHNHGVTSNRPPDGGYPAFDDSSTVATSLRAIGYRTGFIGKYMNEYGVFAAEDPVGTVPPGWSYWFASLGSRYNGWWANVNGRLQRFRYRARDYHTDVLASRAERFIARNLRAERPFFAMVSTLAAHTDGSRRDERFNPPSAPRHSDAFKRASLPRPPSFNEGDVSDKPSFIRGLPRLGPVERRQLRDHHRARLRSLLAVDELVGRLIRTLRAARALRNTFVIFSSDNGYALGEHRLRNSKFSLYEPTARVPFIVRGPGVPAGAARSQLAGNIDFTPTVLEIAGAPAPDPIDGISLLPLIADLNYLADRDLLLENTRGTAIRSPGWMYAEHPADGPAREWQLYDLAADPYQLESLHDTTDPSVVAKRTELARRLAELRACSGSSCR